MEDRGNQWTLSRAILSMILINEEVMTILFLLRSILICCIYACFRCHKLKLTLSILVKSHTLPEWCFHIIVFTTFGLLSVKCGMLPVLFPPLKARAFAWVYCYFSYLEPNTTSFCYLYLRQKIDHFVSYKKD